MAARLLPLIRSGSIDAGQIERQSNIRLNEVTVNNNEAVYFLTYSNITAASPTALIGNGTGFYKEPCRDTRPIEVPDAPICLDLNLTVRNNDENGSVVTTLAPNSVYAVSAGVNYDPEDLSNSVTFRTNYGAFIANTPSGRNILQDFRDRGLTLEQYNVQRRIALGLDPLPTDIEANEATTVFFITNNNIDTSIRDALRVNATNFSNSSCREEVPLNPAPGICEDLELDPVEIPFDPNNKQNIDIRGSFDEHEGEIRVVVTGEAQVAKDGSNSFGSTITFTESEVADSNNRLRFRYEPTADFDPTRDTITLTAVAVGAEQTCRDEITTEVVQACENLEITRPDTPWKVGSDTGENPDQRVELAVRTEPSDLRDDLFYHWEISGPGTWSSNDEKTDVTDDLENTIRDYNQNTSIRVFATFEEDDDSAIRFGGRTVCADQVNAQGDEEPEIEKLVYLEDEFEDASDILNMNSQADYVTYGVVFKPGNQVRSAYIRETSMDNGRIDGSLGGYLEFEDMIINIIDGDKRYTLLRTDGYNVQADGDEDEIFSDENFTVDGNSSLNDFEEDYRCENNENEICLKGDFEEAVNNFKDGKRLDFQNLDLGENVRIIVKYQMTNHTEIDEEYCKNLPAGGGCGEQFNNEAEFEAYPDNEFGEGDDTECIERKYCEDREDDNDICESDDINSYCGEIPPTVCEDDDTDCIERVSEYEACQSDLRNFCEDREGESDICSDSVLEDEYCEDTNENGETFSGSDDARVIVVCPYILLRTGGDTFFRDVLDVGVDIAQCSEVKNTPGTITTEIVRRNRVVSTGGEETFTLSTPTNEICSSSNTSTNDSFEEYSNVLKNFSSTVCELAAEVAEGWTEKNISQAVEANITRLARFGANLNSINEITGMNSLSGAENPGSGVYVKDNGDLTINLGTQTIQAEGEVPATQTYIVRGHNLIIKSDARYGATDFTDPRRIPSAAFIVIDGNVIIDNNVKNIDGIVMAVRINDQEAGKITNGNPQEGTRNILAINGSLIGNVLELFQSRQGVGDPTRDEGSVTIRYDQRLLVNPPPGLSELVDISQLRVAR